MNCHNRIIEVGMVLRGFQSDKYQITKVDKRDGHMYAFASLVKADGTLTLDAPFGPLTEDKMPSGWGRDWEIVSLPKAAPAPQPNAAGEDNDRVMDFFRASSHPENCNKCGAPKPCSYHP